MGHAQAEREVPPTPASREPRRRTELFAALLAVVAGAAIVAGVPELRHSISLVFRGDFGGLRVYVRGLGAGGLGLLVGLMLCHAVLFYPSEIVTATTAFVYGFLPGLGLAVGGWLLSALLSYGLGRVVGRPLLRAVLGSRFQHLEQAVTRGGTALLISGRLVPVVPFSLLGYVAGAAHVPVSRFAWTTVVGYLPLTAAVSYLGSHAQTLSLSDPLVWAAGALLIALFAAAQTVNVKRR